MLAALICGLDRVGIGPQPTQDWKTLAKLLEQSAAPTDVVALTGHYEFESQFDYFVLEHYLGRWNHPVILLMDRPSDPVLRELGQRKRIWVVGRDPASDTAEFFPGWKIGQQRGVGIGDLIWVVYPPGKLVPQAATTPPITVAQPLGSD